MNDNYIDFQSIIGKSLLKYPELQEIHKADSEEKSYIQGQNSILFKHDQSFNFFGVLCKRSIFNWRFNGLISLKGIDFNLSSPEPITYYLHTLGNCLLFTAIYDNDRCHRIIINSENPEGFYMKDFNKTFAFMLLKKKLSYTIQGYNREGLLVVSNEISKDKFIKFA